MAWTRVILGKVVRPWVYFEVLLWDEREQEEPWMVFGLSDQKARGALNQDGEGMGGADYV